MDPAPDLYGNPAGHDWDGNDQGKPARMAGIPDCVGSVLIQGQARGGILAARVWGGI